MPMCYALHYMQLYSFRDSCMKFLTILCLLSSCSEVGASESRVITVYNKNSRMSGSGFYLKTIKDTSYYVTNLHVCSASYRGLEAPSVVTNNNDSLVIRFNGTDKVKDATFVIGSNRYDICIIRIYHTRSNALQFNTQSLSNGDRLRILAPDHMGGFTDGVYVGEDMSHDAYTKTHENSQAFQGRCKSGMSGSALTHNDEVVGVLWGCDRKNTEGYFIPVIHVFDLFRGIPFQD